MSCLCQCFLLGSYCGVRLYNIHIRSHSLCSLILSYDLIFRALSIGERKGGQQHKRCINWMCYWCNTILLLSYTIPILMAPLLNFWCKRIFERNAINIEWRWITTLIHIFSQCQLMSYDWIWVLMLYMETQWCTSHLHIFPSAFATKLQVICTDICFPLKFIQS